MRVNRLLIIIILSIFSISGVQMNAAPTIKVKLDSTILLMGKMTNLNVEIIQNKNEKGSFPFLDNFRENAIVTVCSDSVELRAPSKIDTVDQNGQQKISFSMPVQAFDSGSCLLPSFIYIAGRDTSYSNTVALKVVPVLAEGTDPIDDYANVSDPENPSIFDYVPDWVINYWWIILLAIILIAVAAYLFYRYKKEGTIFKKLPLPTPYEVAFNGLQDLKGKKLWEQGMEKEYYTELTDILRYYLYGRFGVNAMEMTSRQIMAKLKNIEEAKDQRKYFRKILDMADFVKFAKVKPLPEDNVESFDNALKFVEETKPVPVVEEVEAPKGSVPPPFKGSSDKKKGGKK